MTHKINIVKAVYYQMLVNGFHPVIGGSVALYMMHMVNDFNDIDIILEEEEFNNLKLPYECVSPDDESKPIHYKGYKFAGISIKVFKNILPHECRYNIINDIPYSTISDVRESRDILVSKLTDLNRLDLTGELIMKWNKQLC